MTSQISSRRQQTADHDPICEFCSKISRADDGASPLAWFDFRILTQTEDFVAVPALGSIVPGYLLLVTKKHVPSMACLTRGERQRLFAFTGWLARLQAEHWHPPMIFEHGAADESKARAGSCVTHAHWHLVPGPWCLTSPDYTFRRISSFEEFALQYDFKAGYLYFESYNGTALVSEADFVCSQLFRRLLAQSAGKADEWDYAVFPFFDNMKETIRAFSERLP